MKDKRLLNVRVFSRLTRRKLYRELNILNAKQRKYLVAVMLVLMLLLNAFTVSFGIISKRKVLIENIKPVKIIDHETTET